MSVAGRSPGLGERGAEEGASRRVGVDFSGGGTVDGLEEAEVGECPGGLRREGSVQNRTVLVHYSKY